jgi:hypothetical protein
VNILDENVPDSQRVALRSRRVSIRQIGEEVGRKGKKDDEIVTLLHQLDRPTFFTLDSDFYNRRLCHEGYCLVHLDVDDEMAAEYVHRLLRHAELNTRARRMGCVIRVLPTGLKIWRIHQEQEDHHSWQ